MDDFLRFFDKVRSRIPMHIEIGYSSVVDWMIVIYEGRSYAESQKEKMSNGYWMCGTRWD